MAVYEIIHLSKIYAPGAPPANDDLTLTVEAGEIFGLLGDNGAGKTTLVRQMANLLAPTRGHIRLFGKALTAEAMYTPRQVAYMPQSGASFNLLTVAEALYFTAHLRGLSRRDARAERDRLVDQFRLEEVRHRVIPRLSGGQKRLALLASALAASRPVLILDEPTNDLSPQNRRLVWDILRQENHDRGTTIILVTHNAIEAEKVIQRVGIMHQGRLVGLGRPGQLKSDLNQQLRLEIIFVPGSPPELPPGSPPLELSPGRWQLLIDREAAPHYLEKINGASGVEDFRLSTATLEDLYLSLAEDR